MNLSDIFNKEFISKLDNINIQLNRRVNSYYGGNRKSKLKGSSIEFADYKNYTAGDEIRHIDWSAYARLDKPFVKLFMEEKQANINIFIDSSKSMDYGAKNKLLYAKVIAASIAYIALNNMDKVNIFSYNSSISVEKLNLSSKKKFADIINFIDNINPQNNTMLNYCISNIKNKNIGSGFSVIISDFFSDDGYEEAILHLIKYYQQITLVHLLSNEEINPNLHGNISLLDAENNEKQNIFIDENIIKQYKILLDDFKKELIIFCKKRGIMYKFISTDISYIKALNMMWM